MTSLDVKGWKKYKLSDIGKTYNGLRGKAKEDFGRGRPFITYKNIFDHWNIDLNDLEYVKVSEDENQNVVERGDVFFTTSSETSEEVGMSSVILEDPKEDTYLNSFCFGLRFDKNFPLDPLFSKYYFRSELFRKDVIKLAQGSTRFNLSKREFMKLEITLPPFPEQQKIASILSTWDEAIESYQLLLEEKSKIQRGFVQKILHENIEKWPKKKVGQIFDNITRGYVLSRKKVLEEPKDDYIYPVYSSQTLDDGLLGYYNDYLFENALTWTTDGANAGTVNYREKKFYCTNVCGVLISEKGYANKLMASILNSVTHRYVSYVGNPKLMNNVMQDIVIPFPALEIQEEISNTLNLMDNEIELLEKLIAKLKEQKRGLMQLLLTGKVRV